MLENQNYEGSLQKTQWGIYSTSRKVWWLDNSGSQSPQRRKWTLEQSQIRCRGTRSCHSVDTILSVWKQKFAWYGQESTKVSRAVTEAKSYLYGQFIEFGKSCEELSRNHRTSTTHRSETKGIAERVVRRVKEGTSAVLLQSGLDEKWWSDSVECCSYLWNVQDLLADGKTPYERRFGKSFKGQIIPFGALVEYLPNSERDKARVHQFGKKVLPGIFIGYALIAGEFGKETFWLLKVKNWKFGFIRNISQKTECKRSPDNPKRRRIWIFCAEGSAKLSGRYYEFQEPTLRRESTERRESQRRISWRTGRVSTWRNKRWRRNP